MTWIVVLLASLLIAGLRFLMRSRSAPPEPPAAESKAPDEQPPA